MRLVDTHCHLDFPDYKDDLGEVISRASYGGVERMIIPGANVPSSRKAVEIAAGSAPVFAAVGIHPHDADKVSGNDINEIRALALSSDKVVAIGEIGLDEYKGFSKIENQKGLFRRQLELARDLDLPVILHNRNADKNFLEILEETAPFSSGGVAHCFSASEGTLHEVLRMGLHISFTGSITFEKAEDQRALLKHVPLERLLLETDSPYMSPGPARGKRNEPANVRLLLDVYARNYSLSLEDIARVTTHNANSLFKLGLREDPVIAYPIRSSLYLNITNRCTNRCAFCTRQYSSFVMGHNLKLAVEPSSDEIIAAIGDVSKYDEVVFCGYGEPTLRLGAVKKVAAYVKKKGGTVRLTTNGQGNIINGRSIAPELKGLVDKVSVSINAPDPEAYNDLCRPVSPREAYGAIIDFLKGSKAAGMDVTVTCLDIAGKEGVDGCKRIAEEAGAHFRLRHLDAVG